MKVARMRGQAWRLLWHDTADLGLARDGLALAEQRGVWRLEALYPWADTRAEHWPPGASPPVLMEGADPAAFGVKAPTRAIASCEGMLRTVSLRAGEGVVNLSWLDAEIRAVTLREPCARVWLESDDDNACVDLALALAAQLRLSVPRASLAAEALSAVMGEPAKPRRLGAPDMPADVAPADAFAHVVGHLTDVILHWAPLAHAGQAIEPVHQMRVALRRLRAGLSVFRRAVDSPAVQAVADMARHLLRLLGPARDWDVFISETGAAVADAFAEDKAVNRLLAAADRKRQAAYAELRTYLDGPEFRGLGIRLAALAGSKSWLAQLGDEQRAVLATDLVAFANHVLDRRLKRLVDAAEDLAALDTAALHKVRLDGKRLRYAAEIFAPLFNRKAVQRFLRRLASLQERLGSLNDNAVTTQLMAEVAGERSGAERAYAAGVVRGFVAARADVARADMARAWDRFRKVKPFW